MARKKKKRVAKQQPPSNLRENILKLESAAKQQTQHIVDIPVKHHYADGMYAREMTMPKGAMVVGKIHKKEHFCIVSKGVVEVISEEKRERIAAPFIYTSKAGAKRALYAIEETVWTTVHASTETDLEALEQELIAETFDDVPCIETDKGDTLCLG